MVGQGHKIECVLIGRFVVDLHVVVDRLFVGQVKVAVLVVRGSERMRGDVLFFWLVILFSFVVGQTTRRDS